MLKNIKRAAALLMSAAFTIALMPAAAFAANSYSITINNTNDNHTYTAYQVFAGNVDSTGKKLTEVTWGNGVKSASLLEDLEDAATGFGGKMDDVNSTTSADELADVVEKLTNDELKKFADIMAVNVKSSGKTGSLNGTNYKILGIEPGYYIVIDTLKSGSLNDAVSRYMLQVAGNAEVSTKSGVPTVTKYVYDYDEEKYVSAIDAGIGDILNFRINVVLPDNLADYDDYTLIINDKMSDTLTFEYYNAMKLNEISLDEDCITYGFDSELNKFSLGIDVLGAGAKGGDTISINYSATLNEAAEAGVANSNDVSITYSNNPNDETETGTTDPDDHICNIYTYKLNIKKIAEGTDKGLNGAGFVFSKKDYYTELVYDHFETTEEKINIYAVIENGVVKSWTNKRSEATVITTENQGLTDINGLDDGEYFLEEITAPDGFNKLKNPVVISIDGKQNEDGEMSSISAVSSCDDPIETTVTTDKSTGIVHLKVENEDGSSIPVTGGTGTAALALTGLMLIVCAGGLVITKRRKIEE